MKKVCNYSCMACVAILNMDGADTTRYKD